MVRDMADLESRIETVAGQPAEAESDGRKAKQHSLQDLIAADQYLANKTAQTRKHNGIRITKLLMPSARGGRGLGDYYC